MCITTVDFNKEITTLIPITIIIIMHIRDASYFTMILHLSNNWYRFHISHKFECNYCYFPKHFVISLLSVLIQVNIRPNEYFIRASKVTSSVCNRTPNDINRMYFLIFALFLHEKNPEINNLQIFIAEVCWDRVFWRITELGMLIGIL